jgi:hypothetical protein
MALSSTQKKRRMRLAAAVLLAALVAIVAIYFYRYWSSFDDACRQERGGEELGGFDRSALGQLVIFFIILALPCVIARSSWALNMYAVVSALVALIWVLALPHAGDPPTECFEGQGGAPDPPFAWLGLPLIIAMSAGFYVIMIVDLVLWLWQRLAPLVSSQPSDDRRR